MPIGWRRDAMKALADTSAPGDDQAYRQAFDKLVAVVRLLHDRGVFIVFGTDTGGSFTYHRELELYQLAGMTPAEILKRATWDSARYVSQDQTLGSIEKGKLADFFLDSRRSDREPKGDQDHQHGRQGRHRLLSERDLSEVRHSAVCCRAKNCEAGRGR